MNKLTNAQKKRAVESYKNIFLRINFNGGMYFNVLKINLEEYVKCERQIEKEFGNNAILKVAIGQKYEYKMQHYEIVAITFAAMFLECLIWDYAAVNTFKNITKDHLSKIDLVGKWKVVPKLVNNNNKVDIDSKSLSLLKKLISERNKIIHSKSKALPDNYDEIIDYISSRSTGTRNITAKEAHQCVLDCTEELKRIDTTDYWFFQKGCWDTYDKYKPHNPF